MSIHAEVMLSWQRRNENSDYFSKLQLQRLNLHSIASMRQVRAVRCVDIGEV